MASPRTPETSIGLLLNDVARLMRRNFDRRVRELGLTQAQWKALAHLSRRQGINQATLAELMEIQPITLARLIDKLEESGLVARHRDPSDRRAVRLYLTEEAAPVLEQMWTRAAETKEEAFENVPAETLNVMIEALQTVRSNLIARDAEARKSCAGVAQDLEEVKTDGQ